VQALVQARDLAIAKDFADQKAAEADAARRLADERLARADWLVYTGQLALAQREWQDNKPRYTLHLLDACQWNLRGWEHRYLYTLFTTGNQLTLKGHTSGVSSVCFSPDGKRLASAGFKEVKVWEVDRAQEVLSLKGHASWVCSVCFSPDGKRLASASGGVRVWDAHSGQEVLEFNGHTTVCFSPDGKRLASGSGTAKGWDLVEAERRLRVAGKRQ
jgi:WD40 repeat protein